MRREAPVAIVGAGPCGLAAAVALKEAGVPAVVFDKSCVVSAIANYPTNLTFFSTPDKLVIGGVSFACAGERPTRREGLAYYRAVVERFRLSVRAHERVAAIERHADGFVVHSVPMGSLGEAPGEAPGKAPGKAPGEAPGKAPGEAPGATNATHARAVVIATGYFDHPNMLGVSGEDLPHVTHRFVDGHEAFQRDALVVGGGNSAVECALELARCGARVTLVHYETGFVSHVIKPWILPEFERRVAEGQIRTLFSARVTAIEPGRVRLQTAAGVVAVDAQHVYLMTGYTPQPGLLGDLGVRFDPATGIPEHDPATMETSVPNVFVAGVLTSGLKANGVFIENGRGHGALIATALKARRASGG